MSGLKYYTKGLAGCIIDFYRMVRLKFINPHSYTKFRIINAIRKKTQAKVFIESGTYRGITAYRCAFFFDRVYTIELDKGLAKQASGLLASKKNVNMIQQDALEALPKLLQDNNVSDALVFLDGHFSGSETACGIIPEPAIEELKILSNYKEKIKAIIIDDFRCFGTEEGFPSKSELLKNAEDGFANNGFKINVQWDQLIIMRK